MIRILLAVLFAMFLSSPVSAQPLDPVIPQGPHNEKPVPTGLQGIWSGPDCTSAQQVFIIAPHYSMFYRPGIYRVGAVQTWRQEDDDGDTLIQLRTNANNPSLIKKTNDGLMKIRLMDVNPLAPLRSAWSMNDDETAPEFAHCAKLFDSSAGITQDEVNAVFLMDAFYKGCKGTTPATFKDDKACQKAIFEAVDSDKNKTLDHAELARIYRQAVLVISGSAFCKTIGYPENSPQESEEFATLALGTDKNLDFDQVVAKLSAPGQTSGRIFTFMENARNTQNLLPFLPPAVTLKTCLLSDPAHDKEIGTVRLPETIPVNAETKPDTKTETKPETRP